MRLISIILCLILGVISSPILSWLCALSPTSWDSTIRWVRDDPQMLAWIESERKKLSPTPAPPTPAIQNILRQATREQHGDSVDRNNADLGYFTVVHGFGIRHHYFSGIPYPLHGPGRLRTGWPFAAFETITPMEPVKLTGFFGTSDPKFDDTSRTVRIGDFQRTIPIRPLWSGLVGNALVLAIIWWFTFAAYRQLRGVARRSRSHCPDCGYDLRGNPSDGCPECGWRRASAESTITDEKDVRLGKPPAHCERSTGQATASCDEERSVENP